MIHWVSLYDEHVVCGPWLLLLVHFYLYSQKCNEMSTILYNMEEKRREQDDTICFYPGSLFSQEKEIELVSAYENCLYFFSRANNTDEHRVHYRQ